MHDRFMKEAIELAVSNVNAGLGGPFAALVVKDNEIIGRGTNRVTTSNDPTAHAEINAIRDACRTIGHFQLNGCEIYTTCEPCPMCLGAVYWARPARIFYAASREDAQAAGFDDEFIYDQLARPLEERSIEMKRAAEADAHRPFEAWKAFERRIEY